MSDETGQAPFDRAVRERVPVAIEALRHCIETMTVTRVHTATGSHIDPPLDQDWDDLMKLRWQAAVVTADTGLAVRVSPAHLQYRATRWSPWRIQSGVYDVHVGSSSCGAMRYAEAWSYLNGVAAGANAAAPRPGPCGHEPDLPREWGQRPPFCSLDAGHAGCHKDEERGTVWKVAQ